MGVLGQQRDQGKEQSGEKRDPALTVKSQCHRSQPKPSIRIVYTNYQGIRGTTDRGVSVRLCAGSPRSGLVRCQGGARCRPGTKC